MTHKPYTADSSAFYSYWTIEKFAGFVHYRLVTAVSEQRLLTSNQICFRHEHTQVNPKLLPRSLQVFYTNGFTFTARWLDWQKQENLPDLPYTYYKSTSKRELCWASSQNALLASNRGPCRVYVFEEAALRDPKESNEWFNPDGELVVLEYLFERKEVTRESLIRDMEITHLEENIEKRYPLLAHETKTKEFWLQWLEDLESVTGLADIEYQLKS